MNTQKDIKFAIIGGSSGDALAEACKKKNLYSILICGRKSDHGYGMGDENYAIDLSEKEKIVKLIKDRSDCLILGTGHKYALEIAKQLYDDNFIVSIDPYKAQYGKNKICAYERIRKFGYNTPGFTVIESYEQYVEKVSKNIVFPVVVKSEDDAVRTAKANNQRQLDDLVKENLEAGSKVIIEQFIEGVEYTIPIISDGNNYYSLSKALDMSDINRIAIAHLRHFDNMDLKYDRKAFLDDNLRTRIESVTIDITKRIGLIGFIRFDLMVDLNKTIYILEINEVAVSRLGSDHYPWEEVGINPAEVMIDNTLKIYNEKAEL